MDFTPTRLRLQKRNYKTIEFWPNQQSEIEIRRTKRFVLWSKNPHCKYCDKKLEFEESTLDHVIPKSKGGSDNWSNLVISCREMQQQKRKSKSCCFSKCIF